VVQPALISTALRAINQQLGRGISLDEAENFINGACFEKIARTPIISDLVNKSAVMSIVQSLIGKVHATHAGQIALRFPGFQAMSTDSGEMCPNVGWAHGWHIDGMGEKRTPGQIGNFTCLLGVFLEDVMTDFSGNLIVHPGGHHLMEHHFRTNGPTECERLGQSALPKFAPLPTPRMVKGRAGDVVICHYLMPHSVAPNLSPHLRYVVYFRLSNVVHHGYRPEALQDAWLDWTGMRSFVTARRSKQAFGPYGYASPDPADEQTALLRAQADPLFDAHKWEEARPLYRRLVDLRPFDSIMCMRPPLLRFLVRTD
jgi:hypothetical protein